MLQNDTLIEKTLGLVHAKTQNGHAGLELTLKSLHRIGKGGALDFGGSEYRAAEWFPVEPQKGPDDKYGWWHLTAGHYRLEFNESLLLQPGQCALVSPLPRLQQAGATHPSTIFGPEEPFFAMLQVFVGGLSLKENCRVSRLNVIDRVSD